MNVDKGEVMEGFGVVKEDWVDENTCLRGEGNYKNGWKEGRWIWYDDENQPLLFGEYLQGEKTGFWYRFYPWGGYPWYVESYKNGMKHGWDINYLPDMKVFLDDSRIPDDSPLTNITRENPYVCSESLYVDDTQILHTYYIGKVETTKSVYNGEDWDEEVSESHQLGNHTPVYPTPVYEDIKKEWGV